MPQTHFSWLNLNGKAESNPNKCKSYYYKAEKLIYSYLSIKISLLRK